MNEVIEIKKAITAALLSIHPRVYYEKAPHNATEPYLVFNLPNSFSDGASTNKFILEVDGWDKAADTTALENLMFSTNKKLDGYIKSLDELTIIVYLDGQLSIPCQEPLIIRRKYNYQIKTIQKRR